MVLEFNKCCFCIELRKGCLIIGYLNLIGNFIMMLISIIGLTTVNKVDVEGEEQDESLGVVIGIMLVVLILFTVFTIILLIGLHKYKRGYVKIYLIYALVFIVLSLIMLIVNLASGLIGVGDVVKDVISFLVSIYFFLVIRSYYLKMNQPSTRPAVYNTAEVSRI